MTRLGDSAFDEDRAEASQTGMDKEIRRRPRRPQPRKGPRPPAGFSRWLDVAASPNERALLSLVFRYGVIGRAELAREADLTIQSVSRLVEGLADRGLLRFGERISTRGNPSGGFGVELSPDGAFTLGVSIMTDALSLVLMNFRGEVLEACFEAQDDVRAEALFARIGRLTEAMIERHVPDRTRLLGAGVAVTGYFVEDGRRINPPPPLEDFALVDLPSMLSDRLGLPVIVENDAGAAAVAESLLGVGRRHGSFAYVHFAAGVGGGIIVDGRLLRGARGNAGEVAGVVPVDRFEDRPSLTLLLEMAREAGVEAASLSDFLSRFDLAMPGVEAWADRVREPLDMIVSSLGAVVDPEVIVLGGRLPRVLAERLIPAITPFSAPRRGAPRPLPPILPAEVGPEPTAIGAAVLPLKAHFFA